MSKSDTERLDWLIRSHVIGPEVKLGFQSNMHGDRAALVVVNGTEFLSYTSMRDAIDKAMDRAALAALEEQP